MTTTPLDCTVTVVLSVAGIAPLQVSVKVVVALKAPVLALPLVGSLSLHPPEAVQLVALLEYAMEAVFLRGSEPWRRPPSGEHAGSRMMGAPSLLN